MWLSVKARLGILGEIPTYVLLLLMDMTNLEPDVFFRQGTGRIIDNVFEALDELVKNKRQERSACIPPSSG